MISLICDKSVTTQNLTFLSYWYRKKRLQMHFSPVYSPEKSQILSCDTLVVNERNIFDIHKCVHLQIYSLYTTNKMSLFSIYLFQ
jgi:hypothetical protein